jgi:hypothetical protein
MIDGEEGGLDTSNVGVQAERFGGETAVSRSGSKGVLLYTINFDRECIKIRAAHR